MGVQEVPWSGGKGWTRTYALEYTGHAKIGSPTPDALAEYQTERLALKRVSDLHAEAAIPAQESEENLILVRSIAAKWAIYDLVQKAGPMIDAALGLS